MTDPTSAADVLYEELEAACRERARRAILDCPDDKTTADGGFFTACADAFKAARQVLAQLEQLA